MREIPTIGQRLEYIRRPCIIGMVAGAVAGMWMALRFLPAPPQDTDFLLTMISGIYCILISNGMMVLGAVAGSVLGIALQP